jgi:hypothetical protein
VPRDRTRHADAPEKRAFTAIQRHRLLGCERDSQPLILMIGSPVKSYRRRVWLMVLERALRAVSLAEDATDRPGHRQPLASVKARCSGLGPARTQGHCECGANGEGRKCGDADDEHESAKSTGHEKPSFHRTKTGPVTKGDGEDGPIERVVYASAWSRSRARCAGYLPHGSEVPQGPIPLHSVGP